MKKVRITMFNKKGFELGTLTIEDVDMKVGSDFKNYWLRHIKTFVNRNTFEIEVEELNK